MPLVLGLADKTVLLERRRAERTGEERRGEEKRGEGSGGDKRREETFGSFSRALSCLLVSCHVGFCPVASRDIAICVYSVRSRHLFSCPVWFAFSRHVRSCRIVFASRRVRSSCHVFSSRVTSSPLVSCHVLSCHTASCHRGGMQGGRSRVQRGGERGERSYTP